jgi:dTDP-glucose 4,6-dehydratase
VKILVTGGNGFVGTHLCCFLPERGDEVVSLDNLATSDRANVETLRGYPGYRFVEDNVTASPEFAEPFDAIAHLACPVSPDDYRRLPLETLAVGSRGSESLSSISRSSPVAVCSSPQRARYTGTRSNAPNGRHTWATSIP